MYWTVQEETAAGLCSSSSTEQPSGMGQSLAKCSPLTWRSTSRISVEVASTKTQCPVWWSLRYLLNQNYPGCWQGVIAPTRSVAFITVSLRPEVITQQLISPGSPMTYGTTELLFILTASCPGEDENDVISGLHMGQKTMGFGSRSRCLCLRTEPLKHKNFLPHSYI